MLDVDDSRDGLMAVIGSDEEQDILAGRPTGQDGLDHLPRTQVRLSQSFEILGRTQGIVMLRRIGIPEP
jgi:hypothetical protein